MLGSLGFTWLAARLSADHAAKGYIERAGQSERACFGAEKHLGVSVKFCPNPLLRSTVFRSLFYSLLALNFQRLFRVSAKFIPLVGMTVEG